MRDKIIRLRKGKQGRVKPGHPWIYKEQILKDHPSIKPGDIVSVIDSNNKFLGRGYYNPRSKISVRILSFTDVPINGDFFNDRIKVSFEKRKNLLAKTNAYRAVFSEADGLPGLIVDVYSDTAVFQILTLGMEKLKQVIAESLKVILKPKYIYEKSISPFRKIEGLKDNRGWRHGEGRTIIEISEGPARFLVDIEKGHKTGFYLDQRKSRMAMEGISKDKKVLDLFCYTGAFSVSAAIFGASSVMGVDIKQEWLDMADKNAGLNNIAGRIKFTKGNAFSVLKNVYNSGETFDIIIVDPPSFMRTKRELVSASKGYENLNLLGMKALNEDGILATFSCSHHMSNENFSGILKQAAKGANKRFVILKRCHQAEDHPIVRDIPETRYLKGYFLKINSV